MPMALGQKKRFWNLIEPLVSSAPTILSAPPLCRAQCGIGSAQAIGNITNQRHAGHVLKDPCAASVPL